MAKYIPGGAGDMVEISLLFYSDLL